MKYSLVMLCAVWAAAGSAALGNVVYSTGAGAETRPTAAPRDTAIDPEAAKTLDDADLVRQLTEPGARPATDPWTMLQDVQRRMGEASNRLSREDPGALTQETQRRIVALLNALIEQASRMPPNASPPPGSGPNPGNPGLRSNPGNSGGNTPASVSGHPGGGATAPKSSEALSAPRKDGWDPRLPQGVIQEFTQGMQETFLPAYSPQIRLYYQALADLNKSR